MFCHTLHRSGMTGMTYILNSVNERIRNPPDYYYISSEQLEKYSEKKNESNKRKLDEEYESNKKLKKATD